MDINYSLSLRVGMQLKYLGMMLATAESCTGGGLAEDITAVPGSSAWFDRSFVTYSNAAKHDMLDVRMETLVTHGAVSEQTAIEMVQGLLKHSRADIGVSITGIAGPGGGSPEKPVGTIWFGLATKDGFCGARRAHFVGGRKHIRRNAIAFAFNWILDVLDRTSRLQAL